MKDYIKERAVAIANYIVDYNATVRQTAKRFGISKSTVHKDDGVIIRIEFQGMRKALVLSGFRDFFGQERSFGRWGSCLFSCYKKI